MFFNLFTVYQYCQSLILYSTEWQIMIKIMNKKRIWKETNVIHSKVQYMDLFIRTPKYTVTTMSIILL